MADLRASIIEILEKALADAREGRFTGFAICGINGDREHLTSWVLDETCPSERSLLTDCAQSLAEGIFLGRGEILSEDASGELQVGDRVRFAPNPRWPDDKLEARVVRFRKDARVAGAPRRRSHAGWIDTVDDTGEERSVRPSRCQRVAL